MRAVIYGLIGMTLGGLILLNTNGSILSEAIKGQLVIITTLCACTGHIVAMIQKSEERILTKMPQTSESAALLTPPPTTTATPPTPVFSENSN